MMIFADDIVIGSESCEQVEICATKKKDESHLQQLRIHKYE